MADRNGIAGLAVTALVSALVALGASALMAGAPPPAPVAPPAAGADAGEITRLRAEVERLGAAVARRPDPAAAAPAGAPLPPATPDAPLPATRAELIEVIDRRIAETGMAVGPDARPVRRRLTVDEAGEEMGLSSIELDGVRRVLRDAETELIASVMGTTDLEAIKEEVRAAKEDPQRKVDLVNKAVGNVIRNAGRLVTLKDRRNRELLKFLSKEQVEKLDRYDLKPQYADAELEEILEDAFGD